MIFKSLAISYALFISIAEAQPGGTTCSGQNNNFSTPSSGSCMNNWSRGNTYEYPDDFQGILSEVATYVCPTSQKRIIISNGIPDHTVTQGNPNAPCEKNWAVMMPLNPTKASSVSELPLRGIIAMATNGVPAYGPQEGGSTNAVEPEPGAQITDAQFWYGHAAMNNDWHFHNPHMGEENPSENDLLGYALDGFPIYGPLSNASVLDGCNGQTVNGQYQYHVRETDQVDAELSYCNGSSPIVNWNYILGCYSGTLDDTLIVDSSSTVNLPADCVLEVTVPTPSKAPSPSSFSTPSKAPSPSSFSTPSKAPSPSSFSTPSATPTFSTTPSDICDIMDVLGQTIFFSVAGLCWRLQLYSGGTLEGDATDPSCSNDESDFQSNGVYSISSTVSLSDNTAVYAPGSFGYSGTFLFKEGPVVQPAVVVLGWNPSAKVYEVELTIPTCSHEAVCPTMRILPTQA